MMAFTLINQTVSAPSNMLHNSIQKAATVLQLFVAWNKSRKTHLILSNLNAVSYTHLTLPTICSV